VFVLIFILFDIMLTEAEAWADIKVFDNKVFVVVGLSLIALGVKFELNVMGLFLDVRTE